MGGGSNLFLWALRESSFAVLHLLAQKPPKGPFIAEQERDEGATNRKRSKLVFRFGDPCIGMGEILSPRTLRLKRVRRGGGAGVR